MTSTPPPVSLKAEVDSISRMRFLDYSGCSHDGGRITVLFAQFALVLMMLLTAEIVAAQSSPATATLDQVVAPDTGASERHILRFAVAEQIGNDFFACARRNGTTRSVHIVDQFGNTIYAARMDGQIADNIDVARMKAESALYFRENTRVWLNRSRDDPALALSLMRLGQFTSPTGLPIIVEDQLLGAIGVGGASGECTHEALTRVLGPQPPLEPESSAQ